MSAQIGRAAGRKRRRGRAFTSLIAALIGAGVLVSLSPRDAAASDHLDAPSVIADPSVDIGDIYAWIAPSEHRLNLAMTVVGHTFSDRANYVFHVDSGAFGRTRVRTDFVCRMHSAQDVECTVGARDAARGDASGEGGLTGRRGHFRVFAGLRDDPFFNNVRGTRAAYQDVRAALDHGATRDGAQCPNLAPQTVTTLFQDWRHTDGGPARNFLAGWTASAIVISVDLNLVNRGGPVLAVWGATLVNGRQIDRMGRPLTGNALLGTIATEEESNRFKEDYNAAAPREWQRFAAEIAKGLALYDGFDGVCGNQLLAASSVGPGRYAALASLLADDRLWLNSNAQSCEHFLAVELSAFAGQSAFANDCGGRTPTMDAIDIYRSELTMGAVSGVDDGVDHDDAQHSVSTFPFLAPPQAAPAVATR